MIKPTSAASWPLCPRCGEPLRYETLGVGERVVDATCSRCGWAGRVEVTPPETGRTHR